ncbi:MAG: type II toxin-antitoxin system RelE/ParE family toxin [Devosia nanyangense]|uniref:Type II toxin-antitoxin system RelE/ParE family toxin n=1 Tax=Devosia nanyangense TaxID=1228055 RepID=A0A933L3U9_9HYPH|nr:type II toxin-antitoxin system RelE/ParE family toxin [Devosia nanyangense]
MTPELRRVEFLGRSRRDLRSFPTLAREQAGRQILLLQQGLEPMDWKPMKSIGAGASEIRVREESGAYRVIYIAKFKEAVYVLHCFEKRSQKTSRADLELATARYREVLARRPRL